MRIFPNRNGFSTISVFSLAWMGNKCRGCTFSLAHYGHFGLLEIIGFLEMHLGMLVLFSNMHIQDGLEHLGILNKVTRQDLLSLKSSGANTDYPPGFWVSILADTWKVNQIFVYRLTHMEEGYSPNGYELVSNNNC